MGDSTANAALLCAAEREGLAADEPALDPGEAITAAPENRNAAATLGPGMDAGSSSAVGRRSRDARTPEVVGVLPESIL